MKKTILAIILLIFSFSYNLHSQTAVWAEKISGSGNEITQKIVLDEAGNIFVGGYFSSDTIHFNNGKSLLNTGRSDGFVAKYNNSGECQWARQISGKHDDIISSIAVDKEGNIYVAGHSFSDTIYFSNSNYIDQTFMRSLFFAKYNNDGTCEWIEQIVGNEANYISDITIDINGYIYIAGHFGSWKLLFNNQQSLTNIKNFDIFLAKYDNTGLCHWAETIAGDSTDKATSITTDLEGNVYITGNYLSDELNFNKDKKLTFDLYAGNEFGFLAKYSSDGECLWAEGLTGDWENYVNKVTTDNSGNVYIAGNFLNQELNFNNGITLAGSGRSATFVAKYNSSGLCQWAEETISTSKDYNRGITIDKNNDIYVTGNYSSSPLKFNNGTELNCIGVSDAFISKYNNSGACLWAERIAGADIDEIKSIIVDDDGYFYVAGEFKSKTLVLNNNISLENTNESFDVYIVKYKQTGTSVTINKDINNNLSLNIFPNPTSDNIEITLTTSDCSNTTLKLYDMSGRLVRDLSSEIINSNNQSLSVNLSTLTSGEYNIFLTCGNEKISKSVVKMR